VAHRNLWQHVMVMYYVTDKYYSVSFFRNLNFCMLLDLSLETEIYSYSAGCLHS